MPTNSLADRIRASRKSRSPVQDTVERHYDEIINAIAGGGSYRDLHAQLTREGHNVGKAHGSLYAAYQAVKARRAKAEVKARQVPQVELAHPGAPDGSTSSALSSNEPPSVIIDTRRKTTDWE